MVFKKAKIGISQIFTLVTIVTKVHRVIYTLKVAKPLKVLNLCPSTNIYIICVRT